MNKPFTVDLFAEDRAHEEWLKHLLARLARETSRDIQIRVRSARGGHGRVTSELKLYQRSLTRHVVPGTPDVLVVAIDANCATYASAQRMVEDCLNDEWKASVVKATPDPHVERWYLADAEAFHEVVGIAPSVTQDKCERDYYKSVLARAIVDAGHPPTLGGLEFARELVEAMDFYRAGKADSSLKHFIEEARNRLQTLNA